MNFQQLRSIREAARRTLGMRHFDVQLVGGIVLHDGKIAEMRTGEGKTLTATLSTFLRALPGLGTHVITVNDYLAERDAELNGEIYKLLGLTVGCILTPMESDERREAYARDVTYGTAKEMGFDFLRDGERLAPRVAELRALGCRVSVFADADREGGLEF